MTWFIPGLIFAIAVVPLTVTAIRFINWLSRTSTNLAQHLNKLAKLALKVCVALLLLGAIIAALFLLGCDESEDPSTFPAFHDHLELKKVLC